MIGAPDQQRIADRVEADIVAVVADKLGMGIEAEATREAILRSHLFSELTLIEKRAEIAALSSLIFRRNEFPDLVAVDPSGQILVAIINRIKKRIGFVSAEVAEQPSITIREDLDESGALDTRNPIVIALEKASERFHREPRGRGRAKRLESVWREIDWIGARLASGDLALAEEALVSLIAQQSRDGRAEMLSNR